MAMGRTSLFAAASLAILAACASANAEEAGQTPARGVATPPGNMPSAQPTSAATSPQATGTTVGAIVVTANKREQNINEVPMSISAATGDQLTRLGVTDTQQLTKIVPGFNYTPTYYGTPVYSIRGVGFVDTSLAASPTVSVYTDEVPCRTPSSPRARRWTCSGWKSSRDRRALCLAKMLRAGRSTTSPTSRPTPCRGEWISATPI